MGKRGPAKKPSAISRLQGNPGHRALNPDEPVSPEMTSLRPPRILRGIARKEWQRVAPLLSTMGVLREADTALLSAYCHAYQEWCEAVSWMAENGSTMTIRDDKGFVKSVQVVPQWRIAQGAAERMKRLGAEFGLSPSSRAALKVEKKAKQDEWSMFLSAPAPGATQQPS